MRIIAGTARGRRLASAKLAGLRPTLDRVREAVFNVVADWLPDCAFLDLFAGTGAVGLEALSRGAAAATLIERDSRVTRLIQENARRVHTSGNLAVIRADVLRLPTWAPRVEGPFDLAYMDPPYRLFETRSELERVMSLAQELFNRGLIAKSGLLLLEHPHRLTALPDASRRLRYGDTAVSIFDSRP